MDTLGKMVLSGSVWAWDPLGIFLYIPTILLDQVLVCLLAPGFIAIALYSHQGPYFRQIKLDFTLCNIYISRGTHFFCGTIGMNSRFLHVVLLFQRYYRVTFGRFKLEIYRNEHYLLWKWYIKVSLIHN